MLNSLVLVVLLILLTVEKNLRDSWCCEDESCQEGMGSNGEKQMFVTGKCTVNVKRNKDPLSTKHQTAREKK